MSRKLIAASLLLCALNAQAEQLVTLDTRPGVQEKYILIEPEKPVASVILFAGGKGALGLSSFFGSPSIGWGKNNFLVRSRDLFAKAGLMVAVVDAPSDRQSKKGMYVGGYRTSAEQLTDMDKVIADLRKRSDVPVWLVGTSRGTESATYLAIHSKQHPAGLVLTSPMSVSNRKGTAVTEMALNAVKIPTLIVVNQDDACRYTPPSGAQQIARRLTAAPKVEVKRVSGGDTPRSKPCRSKSYHGFFGIEPEVVKTIADFIKTH